MILDILQYVAVGLQVAGVMICFGAYLADYLMDRRNNRRGTR